MTARPSDSPDCPPGPGLSPWSGTEEAREALKSAAGLSLSEWADDAIDRAAGAASAIIEDYAPDAPQALKDEALVRAVAYLASSRNGALSSASLGPQSRTYEVHHAGLFRKSGAQGLLATWRVRTVGRCE